jgi:hypothetical protein
MTSPKATEIMDTLEVALKTISGVSVFRSSESLSLPTTTQFPAILFRPIRNLVTGQMGGNTKIELEIGIEGRVAATQDQIDIDLDQLLYNIRASLSIGDFEPLSGHTRAFSATEPGVSLGEAHYIFPQPGVLTASVEMSLTCRYLERY